MDNLSFLLCLLVRVCKHACACAWVLGTEPNASRMWSECSHWARFLAQINYFFLISFSFLYQLALCWENSFPFFLCGSMNLWSIGVYVIFVYYNCWRRCSNDFNSMDSPNKMASLSFDLPPTIPWTPSGTRIVFQAHFSRPCPWTSHFSAGPLGSRMYHPLFL